MFAGACRPRTLRRESSGTAVSDAIFVRTFEVMSYDIDHMPLDVIFPPMPSAHSWTLNDRLIALPQDGA
jgi:hypothetical protein